MRITRLQEKVRRALAKGGLPELARLALKQLRPHPATAPEELSDLDKRYGLDTLGRIDQLDLDTRAFSNWVHGTRYQASDAGLILKLALATHPAGRLHLRRPRLRKRAHAVLGN